MSDTNKEQLHIFKSLDELLDARWRFDQHAYILMEITGLDATILVKGIRL